MKELIIDTINKIELSEKQGKKILYILITDKTCLTCVYKGMSNKIMPCSLCYKCGIKEMSHWSWNKKL